MQRDLDLEEAPGSGRLATIHISSEPPHARVYLNDRLIGTTPIEEEKLEPGSYLLRIKDVEGEYEVHTTRFTVDVGEEKIFSENLVRKTGILRVSSEPRHAQVYLNDRLIGTTPIEEERIAPGSYRLRIEDAEGKYETHTTAFTVDVDEEKVFSQNLVRKTGTLKVLSEPTDADVYVDGDLKGKASQFEEGLSLPTGMREVELRKKGYVSHRETVQMDYKQIRELKVTLQALQAYAEIQSKMDTWKRWKVVSLTTTILSGAASATFWVFAEQNYKDYQAATNREDADTFRRNAEELDQLKIAAAVAAGVQLVTYFYTSSKHSYYKKQLQSSEVSEKGDADLAQSLSLRIAPAVRLDGGGTCVGLDIRF